MHVKNFRHNNGKAVVNVFRDGDDLPKKPFMQISCDIINGQSTIVFENIPYGRYAAIVFHDENVNGELDHKFFYPAEPIGFSNGWELTLFSGMPSFEKLRFSFSEFKNEYTITIHD